MKSTLADDHSLLLVFKGLVSWIAAAVNSAGREASEWLDRVCGDLLSCPEHGALMLIAILLEHEAMVLESDLQAGARESPDSAGSA